jgi:DNA-binding response OmpR family regulator/DNA-binding CsgD family transcriptional regulator
MATVLVVDDVPANISVLLDFLSDAGYHVLVAESGESALEQLGYAVPDLIILDALMPGLDGFETCRRIKARREWADIPVLFMTALSESSDKVRAFEAGGSDYISKPVFCEEVLARIKAHLRIRSLQEGLQERNRQLNEEVLRRRETEAQLERALDQAVIVATEDAQMLFCSRSAEQILQRYFGTDEHGQLPEALSEWFWHPDATPRTEPFRLSRQESELTVHLFAEAGNAESFLLLLQEKKAIPGFEALRGLGLTEREAEVLFWIAQGKTNPEIGLILHAAANTIKKHTQNVLQKLSVETRTAAARRALEIIGSGR